MNAWSWWQWEIGPDHPHNAAIRSTQRTIPHRNQLLKSKGKHFLGMYVSYKTLSLWNEETQLTGTEVCVSALTMSGCTPKYSRTTHSTSRISSTKDISRTSRLHRLTSAKFLFLLTDLGRGQNTQITYFTPETTRKHRKYMKKSLQS